MTYLSEIANSIKPYVPGEQLNDKKYIKLNTNENPYPPSMRVNNLLKNFDYNTLRLYPDPESSEFKTILSKYYNLDKDQIFIGNGSDEILALSFITFFNRDDKILFPDITYSFYDVYSNLFRVKYKKIPLNINFEIDINDYNLDAKGIIIANPNAPTGIYLEKKKIEKLIQNNKGKMIIVDEAYIDFGGESCIDLIDKYENLLIVRTLSKSRSLAGIRMGFALGNREIIKGLNKIKNSFNSYTINRLSERIAIESFKDEEYYKECLNKIINTRNNMKDNLNNLGFKVLDSKSNFLFIEHKDILAEKIFTKMREQGVLIRYFNKNRIDNFLRVSIGTEVEMGIFINKLKIVLSNDS
jgi:histidinol-phosphate aminotransferase